MVSRRTSFRNTAAVILGFWLVASGCGQGFNCAVQQAPSQDEIRGDIRNVSDGFIQALLRRNGDAVRGYISRETDALAVANGQRFTGMGIAQAVQNDRFPVMDPDQLEMAQPTLDIAPTGNEVVVTYSGTGAFISGSTRTRRGPFTIQMTWVREADGWKMRRYEQSQDASRRRDIGW